MELDNGAGAVYIASITTASASPKIQSHRTMSARETRLVLFPNLGAIGYGGSSEQATTHAYVRAKPSSYLVLKWNRAVL